MAAACYRQVPTRKALPTMIQKESRAGMSSVALDPAYLASRVLPQTSLFFFFWKAFELLHPGESFLPSWHVQAIRHALTEVAEGRTNRLLLTVPPRHGKSLSTSVCLPAWMLGQRPGLKIISASYGGELAPRRPSRVALLANSTDAGQGDTCRNPVCAP